MQKTPPKPRVWIPFSPTSRSSVGRCRNVVSSALNTVVSTDSRPLRDRQSGHFLETASLHPPLAALRRFPAPLPLIIQNIEGVFLTISGRRGRRPPTEFEGVFRAIGGPMPTSARTKELCTPYILHRQRQRRKRRDDATLRPLAKHSQTCGTHLNDLNRAGRAKGFLNRRFRRHSLGTFFRRRKKVPRRRHSSLAARRKGEKVLATWGVMKYNVIICVNSM